MTCGSIISLPKRGIIPGAQALLGFQLAVTLTKASSELPPESKIAHAVALCCLAIAVLFLMALASLRRIGFNGENDPQFLKVGSWFVIAAPLPLAFGYLRRELPAFFGLSRWIIADTPALRRSASFRSIGRPCFFRRSRNASSAIS